MRSNLNPTVFKYSYDWALDVVLSFTEKQSRGTETLHRMAGVSHEQLVRGMVNMVRSDDQLQWRAIKLMIKGLRHYNWRDFKTADVTERRKYLTIVKWNAQDVILSQDSAQNVVDGKLDFG